MMHPSIVTFYVFSILDRGCCCRYIYIYIYVFLEIFFIYFFFFAFYLFGWNLMRGIIIGSNDIRKLLPAFPFNEMYFCSAANVGLSTMISVLLFNSSSTFLIFNMILECLCYSTSFQYILLTFHFKCNTFD